MTFTLAIVGRPNVGKSTLFNRFTGKKMAIVDNTPGVTRDWRVAEAQLMGLKFNIIDTAGLEEKFDDSMEGRMRKQTESALAEADMAMLMIDSRVGVTQMDKHFALWLRKQKIKTCLVANKCESKAGDDGLYEAFELGLGAPIAVSAEHGVGMEEIYDIIKPHIPEEEKIKTDEDFAAEYEEGSELGFGDEALDAAEEKKPIKVAIVGRPNVGKSTLLNALLGEQRVMTGPEPGVTRDAIAVDFEFEGRDFKLVDTAGIRRRAKVTNKIEILSVEDSLRAVRLAQIVVVVLDANMVFDKQDLQIAAQVIDEGRALIVAVNKWDIAEDKEEILKKLKDKLDLSLSQVKNIPTVNISALKGGRRLSTLMKRMLGTYKIWNKRVKTRPLNLWLKEMEARHPAPLTQGRPNRLRYITQIKTRPPTFAMWVSRPQDLPNTYKRYLINGLREDFEIPGVPVRLLIRTSENPYHNT